MNRVNCGRCGTPYSYPLSLPFHDFHHRIYCYSCEWSFTPKCGQNVQTLCCSNSKCQQPLELYRPGFPSLLTTSDTCGNGTSTATSSNSSCSDSSSSSSSSSGSSSNASNCTSGSNATSSKCKWKWNFDEDVQALSPPLLFARQMRPPGISEPAIVSCSHCFHPTTIPPPARSGEPILETINTAYENTLPPMAILSRQEITDYDVRRHDGEGIFRWLVSRVYMDTIPNANASLVEESDKEQLRLIMKEYDDYCEKAYVEFDLEIRSKLDKEREEDWTEQDYENARQWYFELYYYATSPFRAPKSIREDCYVAWLVIKKAPLKLIGFVSNDPTDVEKREKYYAQLRAKYESLETEKNGVASDPNDHLFCFCRQPSSDMMIGCDNDSCRWKWFHFSCVGIKEAPKHGKWFCSECSKTKVS